MNSAVILWCLPSMPAPHSRPSSPLISSICHRGLRQILCWFLSGDPYRNASCSYINFSSTACCAQQLNSQRGANRQKQPDWLQAACDSFLACDWLKHRCCDWLSRFFFSRLSCDIKVQFKVSPVTQFTLCGGHVNKYTLNLKGTWTKGSF